MWRRLVGVGAGAGSGGVVTAGVSVAVELLVMDSVVVSVVTGGGGGGVTSATTGVVTLVLVVLVTDLVVPMPVVLFMFGPAVGVLGPPLFLELLLATPYPTPPFSLNEAGLVPDGIGALVVVVVYVVVVEPLGSATVTLLVVTVGGATTVWSFVLASDSSTVLLVVEHPATARQMDAAAVRIRIGLLRMLMSRSSKIFVCRSSMAPAQCTSRLSPTPMADLVPRPCLLEC
jgi:hypothetical protein